MLKPYDTNHTYPWKKILLGVLVACLLCGIGYVGYGYFFDRQPANTVITCAPKDSSLKNQGFEFTLDTDGKTIKKVTYSEGVTKEMLEEMAETAKDTSGDLKPYFNQALVALRIRQSSLTDGNETLRWFLTKFSYNEGLYQIKASYEIDMTHKTFKPNDATQTFLKNFGLDAFYNKITQTYEWSESAQQELLKASETEFTCTQN